MLLGAACDVVAPVVFVVFAEADVGDGVVVVLVVVDVVVVWAALQTGSMMGAHGSRPPPSPLPHPLTMDRSSLEKLELRVETCPPSKLVAPAALAGSC